MTLKQLVEFRERLKTTLDVTKIVEEITYLSRNLSYLDKNLDDKYRSVLVQSIENYEQLVNDAEYYKANLEALFNDIQNDINTVSTGFFIANYDIESTVDQDANVRRGRKIYCPEEVLNVVVQRLEKYVDWKYPGLEIGLQEHEWTKRLVAFDPLYLVDPNATLIDDTLNEFTDEYRRRVRPYHLIDINLNSLPQNQIGFAFSWNYLNYKSLDTIKQWLQEVFKVLRPGGTFMFSYNNADTISGAGFAETNWMSYMPKTTLIPMCEMLGYEIIDSFDFDQSASWIEIRKPGQLQTVKAHQALGEINYLNGITIDLDAPAAPQDIKQKQKELERLRQIAIEKGIDTPDRIRYGYTLEKLRAVLKDKN